jgi:hypothetical protein
MTTEQAEFRTRFASVLADLRESGTKDAEAMWMLGSLAAQIIDKSNQKTWGALRTGLSRADYDHILTDFQTQGNALAAAGKTKPAYAMQALAVSIVAGTFSEPLMTDGSKLLDEIVDRAVGFYRANQEPKAN